MWTGAKCRDADERSDVLLGPKMLVIAQDDELRLGDVRIRREAVRYVCIPSIERVELLTIATLNDVGEVKTTIAFSQLLEGAAWLYKVAGGGEA